MNINRTRRVVVNLGNYGERWEAGASVTVSHHDLGFTDEQWAEELAGDDGDRLAAWYREMSSIALSRVNEILDIELEEADRVRDPDEPSFLNHYDEPTPTPRPKPRRK
jgi:hypothetical protein